MRKRWNVSATMRNVEKGQDLLNHPNLKNICIRCNG
ncbi:hypothetical protein [Flavobacterium circumlabens]